METCNVVMMMSLLLSKALASWVLFSSVFDHALLVVELVSKSCYVQLTFNHRPPRLREEDLYTDGAVYDCSLPRSGGFGGLQYRFWSATAPAGPDPVVLAQRKIASMNLRPISIGIDAGASRT